MKKNWIILLCVLLVLASLSACGKAAEAGGSDASETVDSETFEIQAPGCTLRYPARWQEQVQITPDETDSGILRFTAGDVQLFDLLFDQENGTVLGTIIGEEKNTIIRVVPYDLDPERKDFDTLSLMQEDVNVMLQHLSEDYQFVAGEAIEKANEAVFDIETAVTTLKYPQRWKDVVQIDVSDKAVAFSEGNTKLFDVVFEQSDDTIILGSYHDTPVCLTEYDLDPASLSPEDYNRLSAMQEDVNVILQYLKEDPAFQPAEP